MEGIKFDQTKPRMDLLSADFLFGVARVLTYGAKKYSDRNYLGLDKSRVIAAAMRHLVAYMGGEENDPETGESHLYHAACNMMMLDDITKKEVKDENDKRGI